MRHFRPFKIDEYCFLLKVLGSCKNEEQVNQTVQWAINMKQAPEVVEWFRAQAILITKYVVNYPGTVVNMKHDRHHHSFLSNAFQRQREPHASHGQGQIQ